MHMPIDSCCAKKKAYKKDATKLKAFLGTKDFVCYFGGLFKHAGNKSIAIPWRKHYWMRSRALANVLNGTSDLYIRR